MDSLDAMYKEEEARLLKEALGHPYGQCRIGKYWVSIDVLAQKGLRRIVSELGLERRYPVKTDLSGKVVMVEGLSHEDAVNRWLNRRRM